MVLYEILEDSYASRCSTNNDNNLNAASGEYPNSCWTERAEASLPLKSSKLVSSQAQLWQASIELRSRQISRKVILINLVSMLVNLSLAVIAFYFSFTENSASTSAFAADCVLDFISGAIVLWRYYGDLSSVYMQAREQIACIYLGALFLISALAIIVKSVSDITSPDLTSNYDWSPELVYLAAAATVACSVLTIFKCSLFKILRDKSILLDVINTLISTVFAMSIIMSQALINVSPTFWYLDPVLGIVLAIFMIGFGAKVLHHNVNILAPLETSALCTTLTDRSYQALADQSSALNPFNTKNPGQQFKATTAGVLEGSSCPIIELNSWQKADYSTISFRE